MTCEAYAPARHGLRPDKIASRHRERLAIVYVRQSTPQQIERHQESTRLQYALVDRAVEFGWDRERVLVIDDDLGRSARCTARGFLDTRSCYAAALIGASAANHSRLV